MITYHIGLPPGVGEKIQTGPGKAIERAQEIFAGSVAGKWRNLQPVFRRVGVWQGHYEEPEGEAPSDRETVNRIEL